MTREISDAKLALRLSRARGRLVVDRLSPSEVTVVCDLIIAGRETEALELTEFLLPAVDFAVEDWEGVVAIAHE